MAYTTRRQALNNVQTILEDTFKLLKSGKRKVEQYTHAPNAVIAAVPRLLDLARRLADIQSQLKALENEFELSDGKKRTSKKIMKEQDMDRVNKFKEAEDNKTYHEEYPYGRNRGYVRQITRYRYNQLGTDSAKAELKKRYEPKKPLSFPFSQMTLLYEDPKKGFTDVIVTYTIDTTD